MIHKNFINLCLTLLAVCWSVAVQAQMQTPSVDGIDYLLDKSNMTATVFGPVPYSGSHLIIPEKVVYGGEEYKVTSIDFGACSNSSTLVYVDMPFVTSVGRDVFSGCSNLAYVNMPSVTSVNQKAFYGCSSLASVNMSSVTSVGYEAFYGCSSLASVDMPSVTGIGAEAFNGCPIYKLNLSKNLRSIGNKNLPKCGKLILMQQYHRQLKNNHLVNMWYFLCREVLWKLIKLQQYGVTIKARLFQRAMQTLMLQRLHRRKNRVC